MKPYIQQKIRHKKNKYRKAQEVNSTKTSLVVEQMQCAWLVMVVGLALIINITLHNKILELRTTTW